MQQVVDLLTSLSHEVMPSQIQAVTASGFGSQYSRPQLDGQHVYDSNGYNPHVSQESNLGSPAGCSPGIDRYASHSRLHHSPDMGYHGYRSDTSYQSLSRAFSHHTAEPSMSAGINKLPAPVPQMYDSSSPLSRQASYTSAPNVSANSHRVTSSLLDHYDSLEPARRSMPFSKQADRLLVPAEETPPANELTSVFISEAAHMPEETPVGEKSSTTDQKYKTASEISKESDVQKDMPAELGQEQQEAITNPVSCERCVASKVPCLPIAKSTRCQECRRRHRSCSFVEHSINAGMQMLVAVALAAEVATRADDKPAATTAAGTPNPSSSLCSPGGATPNLSFPHPTSTSSHTFAAQIDQFTNQLLRHFAMHKENSNMHDLESSAQSEKYISMQKQVSDVVIRLKSLSEAERNVWA